MQHFSYKGQFLQEDINSYPNNFLKIVNREGCKRQVSVFITKRKPWKRVSETPRNFIWKLWVFLSPAGRNSLRYTENIRTNGWLTQEWLDKSLLFSYTSPNAHWNLLMAKTISEMTLKPLTLSQCPSGKDERLVTIMSPLVSTLWLRCCHIS